MGPRFRRSASLAVGWLADRRIPGPLRSPVYRLYSRITGADPSEARLGLSHYPSLGAFFVRSLREGARPIDGTPEHLVSPADSRLVSLDRVSPEGLLQAKGYGYTVDQLLAGAAEGLDLEGGWAWTLYLGPYDYHRVHTPLAGELVDVRWVPGDRRSVATKVVERVPRLYATNERAVLRLESEHGPYFLVMVGALNVGRIRVVGVPHGASPASSPAAEHAGPARFERGDELARFEMGSTVILVLPPGMASQARTDGTALDPAAAETELVGQKVRLGTAIGRFGPQG